LLESNNAVHADAPAPPRIRVLCAERVSIDLIPQRLDTIWTVPVLAFVLRRLLFFAVFIMQVLERLFERRVPEIYGCRVAALVSGQSIERSYTDFARSKGAPRR
jgi:hypothetical protein